MKQNRKNRSENILENCFFCNARYSQDDFLTLESQENKTTFHATCHKCSTSLLIFSSITGIGIVNLGVATDLDRYEVKRFFRDNIINVDDILELHQFVYGQKASCNLEN